MIKQKLIGIFLIMIILISPITAWTLEDEFIYQDGFENGLLNWTTAKEDSAFSVKSFDNSKQLYFSSGVTDEKVLLNKVLKENVMLNIKITPQNEGEIGLILRYTDEGTYYLIRFNLFNNSALFLKKISGGKYEQLSSVNCKLLQKTSNTISVKVDDDIFDISVNGKTIINMKDDTDNNTIKMGRIGIWGRNAEFFADDVELIESEGEDSFRSMGQFELPFQPKDRLDGSSTLSQFTQRKAELPKEIPLQDLTPITGQNEIFVSLKGNDINDGSKERPFRTVERAITEAKQLRRMGKKGIVVYIREGNYVVTKTLEFDNDVSGTEDHPFILTSYNGEKVVFTSGMTFNSTDLIPVSDNNELSRLKDSAKGKVMCLDLEKMGVKSLGDVKDLMIYSGEQRLDISRYPNTGEVELGKILYGGNFDAKGIMDKNLPAEIEYELSDNTPTKWEDTGEILFQGAVYEEFDKITKNLELKKDTNSIKLLGCSSFGNAVSKKGITHYYKNIFEEIDVAGEWALNSNHRKLYLYPLDEKQRQYVITAFDTNIMQFNNTSNVVINGINIEGTKGKGIIFNGGEGNLVQNCEVRYTGKQGVYFNQCVKSGVLDSKIIEAGFNDSDGIFFYGNYDATESLYGNYSVLDNLKEYKFPRNYVQNCFISASIGSQSGILNQYSLGSIISHNTFVNLYRNAAYINSSPETIFEYNEVCNATQVVDDAGAVYVNGMGFPMGIHVRYNYFHEISGVADAYFDAMVNDCMAYGNISFNTSRGVYVNGGRDNLGYNNIIMDAERVDKKYALNKEVPYYKPTGYVETAYRNHVANATSERSIITNNGIFFTSIWRNRQPRYLQYIEDTIAVDKEKLKGNYVRGEAENKARASTGNCFMYNLAMGKNMQAKVTLDTQDSVVQGLDTNVFYENIKKEYFTDFDNGDYSIKDNSEIYDAIPYFEAPPFQKMGIVQKDDRWVQLPAMTRPIGQMPLNGSKGEVVQDDVQFFWTPSFGATYYILTVAEDSEFKNIVGQYSVKNNYYKTSFKESGKTYYWKVEAKTNAKTMLSEPTFSDVYSFTTMSDREIELYFVPNTYLLKQALKTAKTTLDSISEGNQPGEYKLGTKEMLSEVIQSAEKLTSKKGRQSRVDAELEKIENALIKVKANYNKRYVYLKDFSPESWTALKNKDELRSDGEVLTIGNQSGDVYLNTPTREGDVYCFKLMFEEELKDWMGITPSYTINSQPRYWVILNPGQAELQYNDFNLLKQTFYQITKTDCFTPGVWHDVQIGSIVTDKGVWTTLTIDGEKVVDFLDAETPIYNQGQLYFNVNNKNGGIKLKATDTVYQGQPQVKEEPSEPFMKPLYKKAG